MNIFKKLLALWIWLMLIVCASPASFAYDFQRSVSHANDGMTEFVSGYDVDAVLTKTESAEQSAGARSLFVNFAGFLAAEGTPRFLAPESGPATDLAPPNAWGNVTPPTGVRPGTTTFGNEMHAGIQDLLQQR